MTKARDLSKLLSTANGKIAGANLDVSFENITDTGTEGTKVASGTTGQRGTTAGQLRFNSDTGLAEYYDGTAFKAIDAPPTVSSILPSTSFTANENITITGSNFSIGATVKFVGNDATEYPSPSVTRNSTTEIIAQTPSSILTVANEPYDVIVTNPSGLTGTLADALDAGSTPSFTTASGSLGTLFDSDRAGSNITSIGATDADSQAVTLSLKAGSSVPSGLTFNSNGTFTGTADAVGSATTTTFTVVASDGTNTNERQFSITVNAPVFYSFTSTGTTTWNVPAQYQGISARILVVAGGGAGGRAGGGGGGGVIEHTSFTLGTSHSVTVGAGGVGWTNDSENSAQQRGGNSLFGALTAFGGGGGGYSSSNGFSGGSGGGHGFNGTLSGGASTQTSNNGGTGYGNAGGSGSSGSANAGGGGGGAGAVGNSASSWTGGAGRLFSSFTNYGTNASNTLTGTRGYFAGGGGGDGHGSTRFAGGVGGGATGAGQNSGNNCVGLANTGGGGGAGHYGNGTSNNLNGGTGIVLVRI
jgi:fibronectin-binding autotransporter adhesin